MKDLKRIVFYDGECGLCQRAVHIIAKWDQKKILFFAPLNGLVYKSFFNEESDMTTVVFCNDRKLFTKSDAIIEIAKALGGWKKVGVIFKIIPRFIRDTIYQFIAGQRKKVSCIILSKDERFLN